ncbi:MAG: hypothetical protein NTX45_25270 [Proteobacteria bacterium]|nr:hypothetical protein [Pseudomonadota bacterium]
MKPIYKPLSGVTLSERMEESFPSTYLNSISIIQGVALGLLCERVFKPDNKEVFLLFDPKALPYILISFTSIICVLYEYNWFVGVYRWSPKPLDTICPILIGFFEIGAILNLEHPINYWFLNSLFCFSGSIGFLNTHINTKMKMFEGIKNKKLLFNDFIKNNKISFNICIL